MDGESALIALGSNLDSDAGNRAAHIAAGFAAIAALPRTAVVDVSSVHETDPVGPPGQMRYLNAAARVVTGLPPRELLETLLEIERSRGRDRVDEARWGPRTLDLDLLIYADRVIDEPGLTVPHPRLHERLFVLAPASEIACEMRVPGAGATIGELLERLPRPDSV